MKYLILIILILSIDICYSQNNLCYHNGELLSTDSISMLLTNSRSNSINIDGADYTICEIDSICDFSFHLNLYLSDANSYYGYLPSDKKCVFFPNPEDPYDKMFYTVFFDRLFLQAEKDGNMSVYLDSVFVYYKYNEFNDYETFIETQILNSNCDYWRLYGRDVNIQTNGFKAFGEEIRKVGVKHSLFKLDCYKVPVEYTIDGGIKPALSKYSNVVLPYVDELDEICRKYCEEYQLTRIIFRFWILIPAPFNCRSSKCNSG